MYRAPGKCPTSYRGTSKKLVVVVILPLIPCILGTKIPQNAPALFPNISSIIFTSSISRTDTGPGSNTKSFLNCGA